MWKLHPIPSVAVTIRVLCPHGHDTGRTSCGRRTLYAGAIADMATSPGGSLLSIRIEGIAHSGQVATPPGGLDGLSPRPPLATIGQGLIHPRLTPGPRAWHGEAFRPLGEACLRVGANRTTGCRYVVMDAEGSLCE